ncbi:MAG: 4-hydroxy-tetrahydrodipicolinate synthase [Planctomycetes bacterium]|nr:4-hydroxy-tetrahydrodipicolinate synthase [Planctomycetota bacterium]
MQPLYHGSYVALPSPFHEGRLDLEAFEELIEYHAAHDTDGIVVAGTTGESTTMNEFERRSLIHAAVDFSRGRLPVVAGVGTNCTQSTVELARFADNCGVDGLMVVTPYYNRPSRRGLLTHFGRVADATDSPILLYNVPARTGSDLDPDLACELAARHESIVAIKEASGEVERVARIRQSSDLAVLCGEDRLIRPMALLGAVGAVNVVGNLAPDEVVELLGASTTGGDAERADELEERLASLIRALFIEVNPVPLKAALAHLGRCREEVRSPLAPLEDEHRRRLIAILEEHPLVRETIEG